MMGIDEAGRGRKLQWKSCPDLMCKCYMCVGADMAFGDILFSPLVIQYKIFQGCSQS